MATVKNILDEKGSDVVTISPDASVFEALKLMADKGVGAVLVTEGDSIVGILSERDYARKVILKGKASKDSPVSEIMTKRVLYVRPELSVDECMALMTEKHFRHLPVLDDGKLAGIISIGDVVKAVMDKKEFIINQLENYIYGH
ncbi:MAG: CBS domain-containing protein [bacterium]|nr:CBS domain-containing protein [bacterium]